MFDIVEVGFLPIVHTQGDIDRTYGSLSTKFMKKGIFSLSKMMDSCRTYEHHHFYSPYLIDDYFYFNIFMESNLFNNNAKITNIKKCGSLDLC